MKYKLGVIGAGVMASAIIDCALNNNVLNLNNLIVFDISTKRIQELNQRGIHTANSLEQLINVSEIIMLSVKPQHYLEILSSADFSKVKSIVSIMAGVKINSIRTKLNNPNCAITRAMPNTPCKIGKGFCGLCFDNVSNSHQAFINQLFNACGEVAVFTEDKFDAITSITGSGPAYVYMFINGMINGGMNGGLTYTEAKKMAISTLIGASKLANSSEKSMENLIDSVCSEGGTTIEAINHYRENNLETIISKGIDKCRERSKYLSDNL